jgi:hypothetical protein
MFSARLGIVFALAVVKDSDAERSHIRLFYNFMRYSHWIFFSLFLNETSDTINVRYSKQNNIRRSDSFIDEATRQLSTIPRTKPAFSRCLVP